jgi:hypothetical protein
MVILAIACLLSGSGLVLAFSPGLLTLAPTWSLLFAAIALVAAVARAFLADEPAG